MEKQARFLENYYLENLLNKLIEEINEENGIEINLQINADTRKEAYTKVNFISAIADLMDTGDFLDDIDFNFDYVEEILFLDFLN